MATSKSANDAFTSEYEAYCQSNGTPAQLELLLCDLNGVFRGKWLPGDAAEKLTKGAVRLPLSTYAPGIMGHEVEESGLGIVIGDPDGILVPVPGTLRPAPWLGADTAQVLVEMTDKTGAISPNSPREKLSTMLTRFADKGLRPVVATELEFYILRARTERSDPPVPPAFTPDAQNYDAEVLARHQGMLGEILSVSAAQGLPTDTLIAEYGQGQFEINFHHTEDVLAAAETALLFRRLVRGVVASHGLEATFMAKPYADDPGNGMHVHASVLDRDGKNIFTPSADETLSANLQNAVAGLLVTMPDLQAIFAPHGNSYRRYLPDSFAPAQPDWGFDHRAAAVRLPETTGPAARLEHRVAGADTNPYLSLAAILGGMLHGLQTKPPLPPALDANDAIPAKHMEHDWTAALDRFATSETAAEIFGPYRDLYTTVKREEIRTIQSAITPAEYTYYLSRF